VCVGEPAFALQIDDSRLLGLPLSESHAARSTVSIAAT
jgi:hypothetical protein